MGWVRENLTDEVVSESLKEETDEKGEKENSILEIHKDFHYHLRMHYYYLRIK